MSLALACAARLYADPLGHPDSRLNFNPATVRAPEFATWVITSDAVGSTTDKGAEGGEKKKKEGDKEDSPSPRLIVTKTGNFYHHEARNSDETTEDKWCLGDIQVAIRPEWQEPIISTAENRGNPFYTDYSKSDFPEFRWVSQKNYVGVEDLGDRVCFVFKEDIDISKDDRRRWTEMASGSAVSMPVRVWAEAYIDYYSHLPVKLVWGEETRNYRFAIPSQKKLVVPADIEKAVNAWQQQRKELLRTPARP